MRFKIFCVPGDHRDDFGVLENQLNDWAEKTKPKIVTLNSDVTAMSDTKNVGRYIMSVLVAYQTE